MKALANSIIFVGLLVLQHENSCLALLPSISRERPSAYSPRGPVPSKKGGWTTTIVSPLFSGTARRLQLERRRRQGEYLSKTSSSSATALPMVLTTPESIIEQASTVNLLDDLIDESVRTSPRRPIMMQFDPSSGWIWRRWKGTIFSETWTSCVKNMVYASIIFFLYKQYPGIKDHLNGFGTLWGQLLSVTTFTLTFFVNQSYALWRKCYELSRRLQGRLHDIGMNLATHATRKVPTTSEETSTYTAASRQILELMSRYIRLFDLLTYASFTRSHRPILTPRGMRRLVERGLMTAQERAVLVDAAIPATQRHSAILMWMIRLFVEGRASGHIQGGDGFEQQTMEKFHIIRAQYGAIGDELQGRMPLAYAHVVQILVDLILWMYPVMAFSISMSPVVAIAGTGLLTLSYQGLFDLAKQFLDPYDNENYGKGEDPLSVDTLIAETNAGSVRWMYGFEEMPFSQEKLREGELYDYLLPVRGYSLEELTQMEEEKLQREKELVEQRLREEEERIDREAEEVRAAAEKDNIGDEDQEPDEALGGDPSGVAVEEQEPTPVVEDRPVHKITTLADGTVVSFKEAPQILGVASLKVASDVKPVAPDPGIPKGAAPYLASLSRTGSASTPQKVLKSKSPASDQNPAIQEEPVSKEVAPIDQVVPLSQIPNKEMKDVTEVVAMGLTQEGYETTMAVSKGIPQLEVLETIEITNETPVKENRKDNVMMSTNDETKLLVDSESTDKKSGAMDKPPQQVSSSSIPNLEVVESPDGGPVLIDGSEGTMIVESMRDEGISKFQIESGGGTTADTPSRTGEEVDDIATTEAKMAEDNFADDDLGSRDVDADASESQEPEPPARLTLADYNVQVEKIMERAKEELLETEAILRARPGADPLGWDYDDKQLAPSTDGSEEEEEEEREEEVKEEEPLNLDVLEMDGAGDNDQVEAARRTLKASTVDLGTETTVDDTGEIHGEQEIDSKDETILVDSDAQSDLQATDEFDEGEISAVQEDTTEAKGTDKIEPIYIDNEDIEEDPEGDTAQDENSDEPDRKSVV